MHRACGTSREWSLKQVQILGRGLLQGLRKESCRRSELREDAKMNTMKIYANQRKLRCCAALVIRHPKNCRNHMERVQPAYIISWSFKILHNLGLSSTCTSLSGDHSCSSANGDILQICTSCCLLAQATAKVVFVWACGMSAKLPVANLAAHDLWPFLEMRFGPVPMIGPIWLKAPMLAFFWMRFQAVQKA